MEPALRLAIELVHASPVRAVLHVSGGAAQSLGKGGAAQAERMQCGPLLQP
jgi:hypothetical protein